MDKGTEALLNGILEKNKIEVEQIKRSSEENVQFKLNKAKEDANGIITNAQKMVQSQVEQLQRTAASSRVMAKRKTILECNDELNQQARQKMFSLVANAVKNQEYENVLLAFLVEGTLALSGDQFIVKTTTAEEAFFTSSFFSKAQKIVQTLSDRTVSYTIANEKITNQGLIIETSNHSMLYDNTINSRAIRYRNKIRATMDNRLTIKEEL